MGISVRDYWLRLGRAKAFVDGGLAIASFGNVYTQPEKIYVT
jgi:hypothetical protein